MPSILHVLLTGGVGNRQSTPNQPQNFFSAPSLRVIEKSDSSGNRIEKPGHSLFELTVKQNAAFAERLILVGNQETCELAEKNLEKLCITNYSKIVEATFRNTAPSIAFAAFAVHPNDILLVTPADHFIEEGTDYSTAVIKAIGFAKQNNLVIFGFSTTPAETVYGYMKIEGEDVLSFCEEPGTESSQNILEKNNFLWVSGIFCFKAGVFLQELRRNAPEVYLRSMDAWQAAGNSVLERGTSLRIPSKSAAAALMAKNTKIKVAPIKLDWSNVSSLEAGTSN